MPIHLGNVEVRLGYLDQSVAHFERALRICRLHKFMSGLVRALNARGWAYRNLGHHEQALSDYIDAYHHSLQLDDTEQTAWILTNISFISTLRGDRQAAYESCKTALKLWEENGLTRGMGAAYSALGGFHVRFNEPAEAMTAYSRALAIFSRERDLDWMSLVRCGRAFAFQSQGELDKAEEDLDWALTYGSVNLRTRIFYSQGLVYWAKQELLMARNKLEECRKLSQEIGDHFHDYKSFADLIELAWEFGEYDRWNAFAQELDSLYGTQQGPDSMRLRASCLRKLGDMAICDGDYAAALAFYEEAFPILAEHEIYERYTIRAQIRQSDERLRACISAALLGNLGRDLAQFWRSNTMMVVKYPEALLIFHTWEKEGDMVEYPA
jgi:tetratricopeptide (TPR) repeat protein